MRTILLKLSPLFLLPIILLLAGAGDAGAGSKANSKRRPNVIIVFTDDQGYGDLSCHGNPVLKTPNLDRLHRQSIRLTDFHVSPMCTPSRSQLMSGQDALRNGAMNVSSGRTLLRRGIVTMADLFRMMGYATGLFGKWHLGDNYPYRPQDRGFEKAIWFPSSHISSAPDYWNNDYFNDHYRTNGQIKKYKGFCTDVFFREAKNWMQAQAARGRPFFAYLPLNAAHGPLFAPAKYRERFKDKKRGLAGFYGMLANIDDNMGKLETMLRKTKLRDNTILIFMTDNGGTAGVPIFNAGMRGRKISLYEGGHRVPCFIRWPAGKLQPPGDISELTEIQDLLPTLVDLCHLKKPARTHFDGTSLAGLLRGQWKHLPNRMLVVQFSRMNAPRPKKGDAAVLWKRWRLVADKELYDLSTDPGQRKDIAKEHPKILAKMRAHYNKWWAGIEPKVNQFSDIIIGSPKENPSMLSPADWQDVFLDQSRQVRLGLKRSGAWGIEVAQDGDYEISLRRWPKEAAKPLRAKLPPYKAVDGTYPAGKALPIAKARLKIGKIDKSKVVEGDAQQVVFRVHLTKGRTHLQTWFYDEDGEELCGAYYVYVRRK